MGNDAKLVFLRICGNDAVLCRLHRFIVSAIFVFSSGSFVALEVFSLHFCIREDNRTFLVKK